MQLMSKKCSALMLKNEMKQMLKQDEPQGFRLQDFPKIDEVETTVTHSPRTTQSSRPRNYVARVSQFSFDEEQQMSFGRLLNAVKTQQNFLSELQQNKENIRSRANRKDTSSGRLKIEKDDHHKLKIVKSKDQARQAKRVEYDAARKQVTIDVRDMFPQDIFTPQRIQQIFQRSLMELAMRMNVDTKQPKKFRGDSFSGSVEISPRRNKKI